VSVLGKEDAAPVVAVMKPFMPQVRAAVARDLRLKKCPALQVAEDRSIVRGARIAALLREGQTPDPDAD
jgi:ribosome-binding factor A